MSRVTRRKHVLKEMMEDDYELPKENQQIVRVVCSRGNNLHEVETAQADDDHFLVTMPTKFRKNVWVKRGDFILVEPIEEGDKVKAEICKILTPEHIKEYTKANIWPKRFTKKNIQNIDKDIQNNKYVDSDSDNDDLEPNMNRPMQPIRNVEEDSDEDDGDEDESSSEED
ncbi:putative RNA-binding protein EIF1AD [Cochliomyia hominivorax]